MLKHPTGRSPGPLFDSVEVKLSEFLESTAMWNEGYVKGFLIEITSVDRATIEEGNERDDQGFSPF